MQYLQAVDQMVLQLLSRLSSANTCSQASSRRFAVCVASDHSTPVLVGDHSHEPVPFAIADLRCESFGADLLPCWCFKLAGQYMASIKTRRNLLGHMRCKYSAFMIGPLCFITRVSSSCTVLRTVARLLHHCLWQIKANGVLRQRLPG